MELGEPDKARQVLIDAYVSGLGLFYFYFTMPPFASEHLDPVAIDPRHVIATIPFVVEALERAGIDILHGMETPAPDPKKADGERK